ncbi:DUF1707 SHOCT-like domain-containing protein [Nocardia sp. CA-135953]|uniref:DUF1707 SHOCT-like domain-containing protein n=1 Tax=Nocardia sp. CA-135953 TaxID=3239978 RepID=UPI003D966D69
MTEAQASRITVTERERALEQLSHHLGTGRLSLTEFDERSAVAAAATTKGQLAELFADLPGATPAAPPPPTGGSTLRRLRTIAAVVSIVAVVLAVATGNWLWLLAGTGTIVAFVVQQLR